jgi:hypothetical protein
MDKGFGLGSKTLVALAPHYIRDLSGVFSVCHAYRSDMTFPAFLAVLEI